MKIERIFAVVVALHPAAVFAAAGHGHEPSFMDLKWFWVNFLIYVGLIYVLCRKPLAKAWQSRRFTIQAAIAEAQKEAAVAKQALHEAEQKLAALPADTAKLAADIEREAQRESADILLAAKTRAERLAAQAKDLAEAERKATESAIRRELVSLAMKKAQERLQKEITPQSDKAIRDSALGSVQQLIQ